MKETLEDIFASYAQGFVDQDVAKIARHFAYPCMLSNQSGTDLVCDDDDLEQHNLGFMTLLKDQQLSGAVPTIVHDHAFGATNRVVSVDWQLIDGAGRSFADLEYLYVLVGGKGNWKISMANLI